jgi:cytochrome c-type biogenesis protein CcmF
MAPAGHVLLILALLCAIYGCGASLYGAWSGERVWVDSARRSMYAMCGIAATAFVILDVAFVTNDFSYNVVAGGSSTTTPFFYRIAAVWATQSGSLLLWVMLLTFWSSLALVITRNKVRELIPYAQAVLFGMAGFFTALTVLFANPFATSSPAPAEGAGLDPLLRHTTMMVHPPMLYSGYTLMLVPFAFAVGALISGRVNAEWIQVTRRFALAAWLCLGIGIMLGARWSYTELGWGGFWAWDPVENAALMPWLLCTAFIHSIMIQEKRGMLKVWNASLVLLSGTMAIIGTFLVRSGILSSIHAFVSDPTLNIAFVSLIGVMAIGSVFLVTLRREQLRTEAHLDSLLSRESMFLLQNLVLVALALVIAWVTFFPLISEAITGTEISVGPPAFRPYVVPLALVIVALSGIGPIIPWRRATLSKLRHNFSFPVSVALVTLVVLLIVPGVTDHLLAMTMFVFGAFVIGTVVQEFFRGTRVRTRIAHEPPPEALVQLVRRNRRRYGGYIVHFGVAIALIGIAASTSFQHARRADLAPGHSVKVDGMTFRYVRPTATASPQKITFGAVIAVFDGSRHVTTVHTTYGLYPSQTSPQPIGRFFNGSQESRVGLDSGLLRDIWVVIQPNTTPLARQISEGNVKFAKAIAAAQTLPAAKRASYLNTIYALRDRLIVELDHRFVAHPWTSQFLIEVSPLVAWLWLGAIIAAFGGLIALWPARRPSRRGSGRPPEAPIGTTPGREPETVPDPRERELVAMRKTRPA